MALRTPTIPWFALLWDFRVKIMLAELRTPQQFLCSMYLKSGKAILREQKTVFFPVKKPHSEEISSGAILGTNLSFTKGGRGVSEFCAGPSNQLRANLSLQPLEKKCLRAAPAGYGAWTTSNALQHCPFQQSGEILVRDLQLQLQWMQIHEAALLSNTYKITCLMCSCGENVVTIVS